MWWTAGHAAPSTALTAVDGAAGAAAHQLLQLVPVSSSDAIGCHVNLLNVQVCAGSRTWRSREEQGSGGLREAMAVCPCCNLREAMASVQVSAWSPPCFALLISPGCDGVLVRHAPAKAPAARRAAHP
jgi:hypothetical protein